MADEQSAVVIRSADGTEHEFPHGFDPKRAAQIVRNQQLTRANETPLKSPTTYDEGFNQSIAQTGRDTLHGATATLPVIGATLGGIAGSGAAPIVGTAAGAGGGAALGEGLRRILNAGIGGDVREMNNMPAQMGAAGASAGITQGAIASFPILKAALSPSAILGNIERKGMDKTPLIREMVKRGATAARGGPARILSRPAWQSSEQPPPEPMPEAYDRYMPNAPSDAAPSSAAPSVEPQATPQPSQPTRPSVKVSDTESLAEFQRLLKQGMPAEEAQAQVAQMQKLRELLGTPSDAAMGARLTSRADTGKWPE